MPTDLRVALFQMKVEWGDVPHNLQTVGQWLKQYAVEADVMILPEMFATGFCIENPELAQPVEGELMQSVCRWSKQYDVALVGSFMCFESGKYFNRAFFAEPDGKVSFYDKRHLFRMGREGECFSAGQKRQIVEYKGWRFLLQVCYDLRFPVFSRNVGNEYDVALYVACWPLARVSSWRALLLARAIENQAYVCGVNVVGTDLMGRQQGGNSMLVDMKGTELAHLSEVDEACVVSDLKYEELQRFRTKFPVWKDADVFSLTEK